MSRRQRTPEERERDRLEREARRAAREGRPAPKTLPPNEVPPPPAPDPAAHSAPPELPPQREERAPEPPPRVPDDLPPREQPRHVPDDAPAPEPPRPAHDDVSGAPREHFRDPEPRWEVPEPLPDEPESHWDRPEESAEPAHDWEENLRPGSPHEAEAPQTNGSGGLGIPPSLPRDVQGVPDPQRPSMPPPFQPTERSQPPVQPPDYVRHRSASRTAAAQAVLQRRRDALAEGRGRSRKRWLAPLIALGLIGAFGLWFLFSLFQPFAGEGEGQVRVVIPQGVGVGQIGDLLAEKGVISSPFFFKARARVSGRAGDLKPGAFRLRKDMSYVAALDALSEGPPPDIVRVTVPEGRARREVKTLIGNQLKGDYLGLTRRSSLIDPRRYGAKRATSLEGFLFPATYDVKKGRPMADLVALQLRAFKREFAKVDMREARRANLTPYEVLTIASMVDREAQIRRERPLVASVIYNRLREGIPLGIDATIRFATNNWNRPLRQSQLAIDSPFNTRSRRGLPPGPIGSPGLAAIRAAAKPAKTGFLFYVVKPGTCGQHAFSKTDAEFQRDVSRYNTERTRRGGKSPTNC